MKDRVLNALMLLAVAAALIAVWLRGGTQENPEILPLTLTRAETPGPTPHPADAYKKTRAETRESEQKALLAILNDPDTDAEMRVLAEKQLTEIAKNSEIELAAEGALLARGYEKALCVARAGEAILFVSGEIGAKDVSLILDLVETASGLLRENIRVSDYAF